MPAEDMQIHLPQSGEDADAYRFSCPILYSHFRSFVRPLSVCELIGGEAIKVSIEAANRLTAAAPFSAQFSPIFLPHFQLSLDLHLLLPGVAGVKASRRVFPLIIESFPSIQS